MKNKKIDRYEYEEYVTYKITLKIITTDKIFTGQKIASCDKTFISLNNLYCNSPTLYLSH